MQSISSKSALRGYEVSETDVLEAFEILRGHVVGQAPHNMPSKNFWKKYKFENRKILNFDFRQKNCTDRPNAISGGTENSFRPKNRF